MKLAEQLHVWHLEAIKEINPESYNLDVQKEYDLLTDEQKFIDEYIAKKLNIFYMKKEAVYEKTTHGVVIAIDLYKEELKNFIYQINKKNHNKEFGFQSIEGCMIALIEKLEEENE